MKKILLEFDYPTINDGKNLDNLCQIYLGGKELHDLQVNREVRLVFDLIDKFKNPNDRVVAGRLDAHDNTSLVNLFDENNILYDIVEGKTKKLNIAKRMFKNILPDYSQPWIFWELDKRTNMQFTIEKYWHCYGGYWLFLILSNEFNIGVWKLAKDMMKYDIWELVKREYSSYNLSILISDDFAIEIFTNKIAPSLLLGDVTEVVIKNKLGITTK